MSYSYPLSNRVRDRVVRDEHGVECGLTRGGIVLRLNFWGPIHPQRCPPHLSMGLAILAIVHSILIFYHLLSNVPTCLRIKKEKKIVGCFYLRVWVFTSGSYIPVFAHFKHSGVFVLAKIERQLFLRAETLSSGDTPTAQTLTNWDALGSPA